MHVYRQKETKETKNIKTLLIKHKQNEAIKDRVIRDIKKIFKQLEDYYQPVGVSYFYGNNYV